MAFIAGKIWYCGSTKYTAVTAWAASASVAAGVVRRQLAAPAFGSERVFACTVAGTTGGSEPAWTLTQGAKTTDNTATWIEVTGKAGVNGDTTNSITWTTVKGLAVTQGEVIYDSTSGSLQVATTAGTAGSGSTPTFSATAGVTTTDSGVTWTSLGSASNFGAYAAPFGTLSGFMAFYQGNDTCYVSNNHAETSSSAISYGSAVNIGANIICVSDTAVPPTATATTGSITTTGTSALTIGTTNGGNLYIFGMNFNCGTGSGNASLTAGLSFGTIHFESCTLNLLNTGTTSVITTGSGNVVARFKNCAFTFGATAQQFTANAYSDIAGGSFAATGTVPTTLFGAIIQTTIRDCDLSAVTGTLIGATLDGVNTLFDSCKLGSGVTLPAAKVGSQDTGSIRIHNCDSGATNYRQHYSAPWGIVDSNTAISRTGGASNGTTGLSWQLATSSAALWPVPFISEPIAQWNSLTGSSHNATIELTTNATLTNKDLWIELEYLGDASSPKNSIITSRIATPLTASTALNSSSATWGGTAQTNKYNITVAFTAQQAGPIRARVYCTKPSITVYVDPLITVA